MTLLNQHHQADVSSLTPMPCDRVDDTSVNNTSTSETLVWYYSNSGTRSAAAGQAAGTMCEAKTTYTGILNSSGSAIGCKDDTSLSFAASTRASTLVRVPEDAFSKMLDMTYAEKVAYMATWLDTNGDYAIDHRRGQIWCLMKATAANDAVTYVYATTLSGGGTGDKVDIIKVGGTATLIQNAAYGTATPGLAIFGKYDATPDTYDDGDAVPLKMDSQGNLYVKDATLGTDVLAVTATGAAAINTTTAIAAEWKVVQVTVHFSAAPTTSENLVLTLDNTTGVAYDTILYSVNPSLSSATDVVYVPDGEMKFRSGDELKVTFTNTDARTYGLSVFYQLI